MINLSGKKIIGVLVTLVALFAPMHANAGIPTTDPGVIAGRALDLAGKGVHYVKVIREAKQRYDTLVGTLENNKEMLENTFGTITSGDFLWKPELLVNVPATSNDLMKLYKQFGDADTGGVSTTGNGGAIELSNRAFELFEQISETLGCDDLLYQISRNECKRKAAKQGHDQGVIVDAIETMDERMANITDLMDKMNTISNQKEREGLIGRIGVEQASLQAESMKLDMYQALINKQDKIYEERESEEEGKKYFSPKVLEPEPIDWSTGGTTGLLSQ